jgi:hypothetical protein
VVRERRPQEVAEQSLAALSVVGGHGHLGVEVEVGMHLRTIYRDGWLATAYGPSTTDRGGSFPFYSAVWLRGCEIPRFSGTEGELYDVTDDPHQLANRFSDPALRNRRDELIADLDAHLPPLAKHLEVDAPT